MKLPANVSVYVGGQKYKGEVPDELVKDTALAPKKPAADEPARANRK